MQNPISQQLIELGLSSYEAPVYMTLLEHSPTSAGFVAKKLGFSRSTVYAALDKLSTKGLVGTTYKNSVKQFIAQSPAIISDLLKTEEQEVNKKIKLFSKISDQLQFLSKNDTQIPKVIFFEGQDSLKKIYMSMLREAPKNSTMYIMRSEFVWNPEWDFVFSEEWNEQVKMWRADQNIVTELLINDSVSEKKHGNYYKKREYTKTRYLPKAQSVKDFAFYILGDTVSLLSLDKNNLIGVKITNSVLAENFKRMFRGIWSGSHAR
jgi:sugar-specific transcriptional regulator TrmB